MSHKSSQLQNSVLLVAFGVLYFGFLWLGYQLYFKAALGVNVAVLWPASGLLMGVLLVTPFRKWPWIIAIAIIGEVSLRLVMEQVPGDRSLLGTIQLLLLFSSVHVLEGLTGAFVVRWFCGEPPTLDALKHILLIIAAGAVMGTFISAVFGSVLITEIYPGSNYWSVFQVWWFSNSLGVLVVAPVVLALRNASQWSFQYRGWRTLELFALWVSLLWVIWFVFAADVTDSHFIIEQPYIVIPFLLWAALRFGAKTLTLAVMATAMLVVHTADGGLGPFVRSGLTIQDITVAAQALLAILATSSRSGQ
jgi:integral membrane sensor domain MASE1